jgi:hypothetical protein
MKRAVRLVYSFKNSESTGVLWFRERELLDKREKTLLGGDDVIGGGGNPAEDSGPQRPRFC